MTGIPTESDEAENERHREKARKHKAARDKIMATKVGEKGLLIVNTGTGKGKTSAALGMVFRHIGHGWPVGVVQYVKSPTWDTGEARLLAKFPELVTLHIYSPPLFRMNMFSLVDAKVVQFFDPVNEEFLSGAGI